MPGHRGAVCKIPGVKSPAVASDRSTGAGEAMTVRRDQSWQLGQLWFPCPKARKAKRV